MGENGEGENNCWGNVMKEENQKYYGRWDFK